MPVDALAKRGKGRPRKVLAVALPEAPVFRWTLRQIAGWHQLSPRALALAIERGELVAEKSGKEWRVEDVEYRRWVSASRTKGGDA